MSNQHVQALENALSGERTHHTISIPATSDDELDCMAALIAVIDRFGRQSMQSYHADHHCKRVLLWFFNRTAHIHGLPNQVAVPGAAYPTQPDYIFGASTTPVAPNINPHYSSVGGSVGAVETPSAKALWELSHPDLQNVCNGLHDKP